MAKRRRLMSRAADQFVTLTYATYNVFQRYWWGQSDPLYAVLSRRGHSVGIEEIEASEDEVDRLCDTAREAVATGDASEKRVGRAFLKEHRGMCPR